MVFVDELVEEDEDVLLELLLEEFSVAGCRLVVVLVGSLMTSG